MELLSHLQQTTWPPKAAAQNVFDDIHAHACHVFGAAQAADTYICIPMNSCSPDGFVRVFASRPPCPSYVVVVSRAACGHFGKRCSSAIRHRFPPAISDAARPLIPRRHVL